MMMDAIPATLPFVKPVETREITIKITETDEVVLTLTGDGATRIKARVQVRPTQRLVAANASVE